MSVNGNHSHIEYWILCSYDVMVLVLVGAVKVVVLVVVVTVLICVLSGGVSSAMFSHRWS